MTLRGLQNRLERLEQAQPPAERPACVSHARLCPLGSYTGAWRITEGDEPAQLYQDLHASDFHALPCQPGDPAGAAYRLAQAGILDEPGQDTGVLYFLPGVDLAKCFE
ncbi:hypothetical protein F4561_002227 [Lipingzhangella halophila]|uniref:Uncharacterized protein n=1 Tax=Lipingzhangella halophila TaxID=1783352 RepID=A0A7W7W1W0_9ACTN|nr:hypothetical protein [Lipingzhangella halophila]MBB4931407.1 hypothetical protein [Lipingzhangella halophila]